MLFNILVFKSLKSPFGQFRVNLWTNLANIDIYLKKNRAFLGSDFLFFDKIISCWGFDLYCVAYMDNRVYFYNTPKLGIT